MKRIEGLAMRSGRVAGCVLVVLLGLSCEAEPLSEQLVSVGSHPLHAVVGGQGVPAIVIDGGIGETSDSYRGLQNRLSSATTVVTYDRAGYGGSEPGPLPRDSERELEELRTLLQDLNIPPPYVLVGHSLGGLNVQLYAGVHPDEVAGMILLDPPPLAFVLGEQFTDLSSMADQMTREWQRMADQGRNSADADERSKAAFYLMLASEHREMFGRSAREVAAIGSFDSIPLVVVASGVPNPALGSMAEPFQRFWAAQSETLAAGSTQGEYVFAAASTHRLQVDAEDLVTTIALKMVASLRGSHR